MKQPKPRKRKWRLKSRDVAVKWFCIAVAADHRLSPLNWTVERLRQPVIKALQNPAQQKARKDARCLHNIPELRQENL